jgi:hypothetical protein
LGQHSDGLGLSESERDRSVDPRFLAPDDEGSDEVSGCRTGQDPLVDVLLGAFADGSAVIGVEPFEELHCFGKSSMQVSASLLRTM